MPLRIPASAIAGLPVAAIYVAVLMWSMSRGNEPTEYLVILAIFALVFPLAAWLTTLGVRTPEAERPAGAAELAATFGLVALVALMLIPGPSAIADWLAPGLAPLPREVLIVWVKITMFVVLPAIVLGMLFSRKPGDFGLGASRLSLPRAALVFIVVAGLFNGVQFLFSDQAEPFRSGQYSAGTLAVVGLITFIWMGVEAGLVEEFFFRAVLQERVAQALKSPLAGALIGAFVFGFAHAPGIALREGGSWPDAIAQAVLILTPAGFAMAYLWMRTRNLLLLAMIHGAGDLVPGFAHIGQLFGLVTLSGST